LVVAPIVAYDAVGGPAHRAVATARQFHAPHLLSRAEIAAWRIYYASFRMETS